MFIAPFASFSITPYILSQRRSLEHATRIAKKIALAVQINPNLYVILQCKNADL